MLNLLAAKLASAEPVALRTDPLTTKRSGVYLLQTPFVPILSVPNPFPARVFRAKLLKNRPFKASLQSPFLQCCTS